MSLFKGENDTTKNSDNMLTMNQKNTPAVRFSDVHFFPLSLVAAHFCYISIFIFFRQKKFSTMEMCPSAEKTFFIIVCVDGWYRVLFVNQFLQLQRHFRCTYVDHNVRPNNCTMVYTEDAEREREVRPFMVWALTICRCSPRAYVNGYFKRAFYGRHSSTSRV